MHRELNIYRTFPSMSRIFVADNFEILNDINIMIMSFTASTAEPAQS